MEIAIAGNSPELALDAAKLWDEIPLTLKGAEGPVVPMPR
jgi:hypothetical protein